ncbi:MAG: hypothetical protein M1569_00745 [Candidatus Marsarchaeota archaeon]|nr:hypothetical protein [Candidatus Marsarchaeota archaeon]MCL5412916.1 hypothetical protein [Candidatus Marsarchaeota archaeon]
MPTRVYECDSKESEALKKIMSYDPYLDKSKSNADLAKLNEDPDANIIFARQDYWIKDGMALGLDRNKVYLIISAVDDFLNKAEQKLKKDVPDIKRAEPESESKIVGEIERERKESESGLGMIFG